MQHAGERKALAYLGLTRVPSSLFRLLFPSSTNPQLPWLVHLASLLLSSSCRPDLVPWCSAWPGRLSGLGPALSVEQGILASKVIPALDFFEGLCVTEKTKDQHKRSQPLGM